MSTLSTTSLPARPAAIPRLYFARPDDFLLYSDVQNGVPVYVISFRLYSSGPGMTGRMVTVGLEFPDFPVYPPTLPPNRTVTFPLAAGGAIPGSSSSRRAPCRRPRPCTANFTCR